MLLRQKDIVSNGVNMKSFVLIGSLEEKDKFVKNFIQENNILSYNIHEYKEKLKISEARAIKKTLGTSIAPGAMRLFLISEEPNVEAQAALLKTIEELPDDSAFIFVSARELLPTIVSRSSVYNLGEIKFIEDVKLMGIIQNLIDDFSSGENLNTLLLFTDVIFSDQDFKFENLVIALRAVLLKFVNEGNFKKAYLVLKILKDVSFMLPLVNKNNLNKKLVLERTLIREFSIQNTP